MKSSDNRGAFEEQWAQAFDGAEVTPPAPVWKKIQNALSGNRGRYLLLVKLMAAASFLFATGLGAYIVLSDQKGSPTEVASQKDSSTSTHDHESLQNESLEKGQQEGAISDQLADSDEKKDKEQSSTKAHSLDRKVPSKDSREILMANNEEPLRKDEATIAGDKEIATDRDALQPILATEMLHTDNYVYATQATIVARSEYFTIPELIHKTEDNQPTMFLAGLNFGAGTFDPNNSRAPSTMTLSETFARQDVATLDNNALNMLYGTQGGFDATEEKTEPGFTYSYGINGGMRLYKRLILRGGIHYLQSNTVTTTSGYFTSQIDGTLIPAISNNFSNVNQRVMYQDSPSYRVNNSYEFISIPLKLGYMVLDEKFSVTVTAGVATDFFIRGQVTSDNEYFTNIDSSPGETSPYKSAYFNGLIGTSFGYQFAKRYSIMLEPQYRTALNSFTKDGNYISSTPNTFMISFGLLYNFQ
ncbi:MAG: hypothetical protein ACFCUU_00635 [Cyclobacteriaceae bacterium]